MLLEENPWFKQAVNLPYLTVIHRDPKGENNMLSLNLYEYGKMNGRNDYNQQHDDNQKALLNVIFKVAEQHNNFPVDELIKLAEEEIVHKYFFNENTNVTDDKKAQDMICTILPSSYDEDEIDAILSELDCSE